MSETGQTILHYRILEKIGVGGMGEVYRAKDTRLDRTVAIKVLPQHAALNADLRARFEREAKALAQALVNTAKAAGCATRALITDMNQPLGPALGTACEVREAVAAAAGAVRPRRS